MYPPLLSSGMTPCGGQECEPGVGRLLVFSVEGQGTDRKVNLVAEVETRGAVYVLNGFNGKLLAGINSKVWSISWHLSLGGTHLILLAVSLHIYKSISRFSFVDSRKQRVPGGI